MAFPADGSSERLCSICLNSVLDDNSRGKAELICGHFFHLDCIGTEFNYKGEMRCPNCRVIEHGEWLHPNDFSEDESPLDVSPLTVVEPRFEYHIYPQEARDNTSSTSRNQIDQEPSSSIISLPALFHQNIEVLPPTLGGNTIAFREDPSGADTLLRAFGDAQSSNSGRQTTAERAVLQEMPMIRELRYYHSSMIPSSPSLVIADTRLMHERRSQSTTMPTNITRSESLSTQFNNDRDISLELTLTSTSSEDQLARASEEQEPENNEEHLDDITDEEF